MIKMIATATAVAFVVYSCKDELGRAKNLSLDETPMQTVQNMFIVQSKNGVIQMRAEGKVMDTKPVVEEVEEDAIGYDDEPTVVTATPKTATKTAAVTDDNDLPRTENGEIDINALLGGI